MKKVGNQISFLRVSCGTEKSYALLQEAEICQEMDTTSSSSGGTFRFLFLRLLHAFFRFFRRFAFLCFVFHSGEKIEAKEKVRSTANEKITKTQAASSAANGLGSLHGWRWIASHFGGDRTSRDYSRGRLIKLQMNIHKEADTSLTIWVHYFYILFCFFICLRVVMWCDEKFSLAVPSLFTCVFHGKSIKFSPIVSHSTQFCSACAF